MRYLDMIIDHKNKALGGSIVANPHNTIGKG
jgi:hypothetical protein